MFSNNKKEPYEKEESVILHIDMDAFFASVEQRDNPDLIGKPVAVGGFSKRSVVATASYEARKFGVHSAMPIFKAKKICPGLIIVPVQKYKYHRASQKIMEIFRTYTPVVEPVSIDEAYLDINGCERIFGNAEEIAVSINNKIKKQLLLTCSIGAAPVKFLAKIASDMNKPDGITIIKPGETEKFIHNIDIRKIPGVGTCAMKQMNILGIKTLGDVRKISRSVLLNKFGKFGIKLYHFSKCRDDTTVKTEEKRKSISSESTLEEDIYDMEKIKQLILFHSQIVGKELRKRNLLAENISIKLKFSDFSRITRQKTLNTPICSSSAIYREAKQLVEKSEIRKRIRLIGVGTSSLSDKNKPVQMELFNSVRAKMNKWEELDRTIDVIWDKFGDDIIKKASLTSYTGKH